MADFFGFCLAVLINSLPFRAGNHVIDFSLKENSTQQLTHQVKVSVPLQLEERQEQ